MKKFKTIVAIALTAFSLVSYGFAAEPCKTEVESSANHLNEKATKMRVVKTKDYDEMCQQIASYVKEQIDAKPDSFLVVATGSTYLGVYKQLVDLYNNEQIDFSKAVTFNLDEYAGIAPDNPQSYTYYMHTNFFDKVNISPENTHLPDGLASDRAAECHRYQALFEKYGSTDLQFLGLGHNGHIAFNEPGDCFITGVHCAKLNDSTIQANKRFFEKEQDVPRFAYTMGIGNIFSSKKIVIAVSDPAKAKILKEAFYGSITPSVPASILQLHNNVTIIGTEDALALL